jgi:hypothetical protein
MTNEEIVLKKLENPFLGKHPIYYKASEMYSLGWFGLSKENYEMNLKKDLEDLESKPDVKSRVGKILSMYDYPTYSVKNKFQCQPKARRSAVDIWRIYKNYFGEIDIFSIMRTLYEIVFVDKTVSTIKCPTVRRQVFWLPKMERWHDRQIEIYSISELGVNIKEWENIGLKESDAEWKR